MPRSKCSKCSNGVESSKDHTGDLSIYLISHSRYQNQNQQYPAATTATSATRHIGRPRLPPSQQTDWLSDFDTLNRLIWERYLEIMRGRR